MTRAPPFLRTRARTTYPPEEVQRVLGWLPRVIASPITETDRKTLIGMAAQAKRNPAWTPTAYQMRLARRLVADFQAATLRGEEPDP